MPNRIGHQSENQMNCLFVVPPIYDFSAFDLWAKPYGFLSLIKMFRENGAGIFFFDFLERTGPLYSKTHEKQFGTGKYFATEVEKPPAYINVPKKYKRFGLPVKEFLEYIDKIPAPDCVFVTSGMTYWYPGVVEVLQTVRNRFPRAMIFVGGVYATLCAKHALKLPADFVFCGRDLEEFAGRFQTISGMPLRCTSGIEPDWSVYQKLSYLCVRTSTGCPFSCDYCASGLMSPHFVQRSPEQVAQEIITNADNFNVRDIVFYDDALMVNFDNHLDRIIRLLDGRKFQFHTPNGIHPRFITEKTAQVLADAGFKTIRLSFEGSDAVVSKASHLKVSMKNLENALRNLQHAGIDIKDIGIYILAGLPGQSPEDVRKTIRLLLSFGAPIKLAEYSPIPGTRLFNEVMKFMPYTDWEEPLNHNNSIFPCWDIPGKWEIINELKAELKTQV
jgi:uncharacterized radical SAM superfamily protein